MAYTFVTSSKDSTIYYNYPQKNTGLDQILEITKTFSNNGYNVSRALIKFNTSDLQSEYTRYGTVPDTVRLLLKQTDSRELPIDYTIHVHAVSGSWEMGDGYFVNDITNTGVTWFDRNKDLESWLEGTSSLQPDVSENNLYPVVHPSGSGGIWYDVPHISQIYSYQSADIDVDVKPIIDIWINGDIENEGFILKYPNEVESDIGNYGTLKFYSKETHTIYQPKLVFGWDIQNYETGSLEVGDVTQLRVSLRDLKPSYRVGKVARFRMVVKERYPLKTFDTPFPYIEQKCLPPTSYYQIRDFISKDVIIPFSDYSKINCDVDGNYIDIDFNNWESNRVYSFEFKTIVDGVTTYFDQKITFNLVDN